MSNRSLRFPRILHLFTVVAVWAVLQRVSHGDDLVNQKIQADTALKKFGVTGKGVIVAILDRGIDWQHPDFIKPDGTTRIKWLLDMSGQQVVEQMGRERRRLQNILRFRLILPCRDTGRSFREMR